MAGILWRDGFDHYNGIVDLGTVYNNTSSFSAFKPGRTNGLSVELVNAGPLSLQIVPQTDLTIHTAVMPLTFPFNENHAFLSMEDTISSDILLSVGTSNNNNTLNIVTANNSYSVVAPLIPQNSWTHIGARLIVGASGSVQVWYNGASVFQQTGIDTRGAAGLVTTVNQSNLIALSNPGLSSQVCFDDYILSNTGFLGDCRVQSDFPNVDHSVAFAPLTGTSNFAMVSETAMDSDATYNSTTTVGATDLFGFPAIMLPHGGQILDVSLVSAARKDDAGSRSFQHKFLSGSSTSVGAASPISTSYQYFIDTFPNDPATGLPWTLAALNAAFAGYLEQA